MAIVIVLGVNYMINDLVSGLYHVVAGLVSACVVLLIITGNRSRSM